MRAAFVPKYPQLLPLDYHSSKRISQLTIIKDPLGDVHRGRSYQAQR